MNLNETAQFFRVSVSLIRRWIHGEGLPVQRTSARGKFIVDQAEALDWWKGRRERVLCSSLAIRPELLDFAKRINSAAGKRSAA